MSILDATDRRLIEETQEGLPLVPRPYSDVAARAGLSENEVMARLDALMTQGVIRRIAAAPNHIRLGMTANGMSVWDVEDDRVDELGKRIGSLPFVTHCYLRARALPQWPYNLFAMIHGSSRDEVEDKRRGIAELLGTACRRDDILYSRRILKKTGLRLPVHSSG
jgi:DNA-binding Lrp family transcriptional regulator